MKSTRLRSSATRVVEIRFTQDLWIISGKAAKAGPDTCALQRRRVRGYVISPLLDVLLAFMNQSYLQRNARLLFDELKSPSELTANGS